MACLAAQGTGHEGVSGHRRSLQALLRSARACHSGCRRSLWRCVEHDWRPWWKQGEVGCEAVYGIERRLSVVIGRQRGALVLVEGQPGGPKAAAAGWSKRVGHSTGSRSRAVV